MTLEDVVDGTTRRYIMVAASEHFFADGIGTMQPEDAFVFEIFSELEDSCFEFGRRLVGGCVGAGFFVVKVDTVESFSFGEGNPALNGRFGFIVVFCSLSKGGTGSVSGDDLSTFGGNVVNCFWCHEGKKG